MISSSASPRSRCNCCSSRRMPAWTVTSRAVVGSSAISSAGSQASAIAIMTRWRCPPESWCGCWSTRRSGSGICTWRSSSTARSRAAAGVSARWARSPSTICAPTRITGFSELIGSWKIMPMCRPWRRRQAAGASPRKPWPSKRPSPATQRTPAGSSPAIASAVSDLPLPDSPTTASVCPRCRSKSTPSTSAAPSPRSRRSPRTCSNGAPTDAGPLPWDVPAFMRACACSARRSGRRRAGSAPAR